MRCIITGLPISDDAAVLRVDDRLPCSPPLQLHTREVTHDGSRTFTRTALRAMHDREPRQPLSHAEQFWWQPEWAERELYAHFPRPYVDVVLLIRRDQVTWDVALSGTGLDPDAVNFIMRRMAKHCQALIRAEAAQATTA